MHIHNSVVCYSLAVGLFWISIWMNAASESNTSIHLSDVHPWDFQLPNCHHCFSKAGRSMAGGAWPFTARRASIILLMLSSQAPLSSFT